MKKGDRYAILGDVHANWEALSAVLEDAEKQRVDAYVCVGDLVGYNADPVRCLDRLRALNVLSVRGNHDHLCACAGGTMSLVAHAAAAVAWTRRQLSASDIQYLSGLQMSAQTGGFTIVHNTLQISADWTYVFTVRDAEESFRFQTTPVCFYGHTHMPIVFEKDARVTYRIYDRIRLDRGRKYLVNIGSVGQPRDRDPRASYAVYDAGRGVVDLRRVRYDIATAQSKIRDAGLPEWLAFRLDFGM